MSQNEAFALITELAIGLGATPMVKYVGCWEYHLGDWLIAVNGHRTPTKCSNGCEVPPFHAYVEHDECPCALLTPFGRMTAGHDQELEDALIADLKSAIHGLHFRRDKENPARAVLDLDSQSPDAVREVQCDDE